MFEWLVKKLSKDNRGFTLIELVVVIAILGILATIAVPKLSGTTQKAAISAHNANVRTLESAASMCIAEEGTTSSDNVEWDGTASTDTDHKWENYVQEWPKVPKELLGKKLPNIKGEKDKVNFDESQDYSVIIDSDGKITVFPEKIGE